VSKKDIAGLMNEALKDGFFDTMNQFGADGEPFFFIIDFEMNHPEIYKLNSVPEGIKYSTPLYTNYNTLHLYNKVVSLEISPVSFSIYSKAFKNVQDNIRTGNSYLVNLTFPTSISSDLSLEEMFYSSIAKYKLIYFDNFIVFSPEIFVRIENGIIQSFPMKGTIDSSVIDAEAVLLGDEKEEAEHATIVDLIRNDMSKIAENVTVTKYRYIDRIKTLSGELLQVSSEIRGNITAVNEKRFGDIISAMLPAGSVTGAPKKETLRIIKESENYERGWYTGIFGVYDGKSFDSGVMIRFIEKRGENLFFKSGGGITSLSDTEKEYQELISKIYVPVG
jgi:para-aminobenzoate synthetase component 1